MIEFREEILKYKPILTIDEIETDVNSDEIKDLMDLLQYIKGKVSNGEE